MNSMHNFLSLLASRHIGVCNIIGWYCLEDAAKKQVLEENRKQIFSHSEMNESIDVLDAG